MPQLYEVVIQAAGEVRDADGNLLDTVTATSTERLTADELKARGITPPEGA
jgi:hypothetical protein